MLKTEPKYVRLARQLKQEIEAGHFPPGSSLPSFKELRQSSGISQITYEKACDILKREGIVIPRRGRYGGVFVAPQKKPASLKPIGYFDLQSSDPSRPTEVQDLPYWSCLLSGIRREAARFGCSVLLVDDLTSLTAWDSISAALVYGAVPRRIETFRQQVPEHIPIVSLLTPTEDTACVVADEPQGVHLLIDELTRQGHQRIGLLANQPHQNILVRQRKDSYLQALQSHGIIPLEEWIREPYMSTMTTDLGYHQFGYQAMRGWLEGGFAATGCTAVVAQNDKMAYGAIDALTEFGWKVPHDVSVTGFDGVMTSNSLLVPELTTIQVPLGEIGALATNLALTTPHTISAHKLPVKLRVGATTSPAYAKQAVLT